MRGTVLDLARPAIVREDAPHERYDWAALAALWNGNDFRGVHDWLNERWARLVRDRILGDADPEARFLQGLAFAAIAFHFAQNDNAEGARMMLDDALVALAAFRPSYRKVRVDAVMESLEELRPLVLALAAGGAPAPQPFVYRRFEYVP